MTHNKIIPLFLMLSFLLLLTACWDQRLLREQSLILTIGYDKGDHDQLKNTVTYPKSGDKTEDTDTQSLSEQGSNSLTMTGHTVKDTEKKMDKIIAEKFDRSKSRVIIFGSDLAKEGIFSTLDSVYRDLRGPLYANIAIFEGEAEDALNIQSEQAAITSDIYANLLDSASQAGITKNENVQIACRIILAHGKDLALPHLSLNEKKDEAIVDGIALFHKDKMTGTLDIDESTMFLILAKERTKYTSLNLKVNDDAKKPYHKFVNFIIKKNKNNIQLIPTKDDVQAKIDITLEIEIDEYAADRLAETDEVKDLSKKIESELNELAEKTLTKTQEANSDVLGLGEKVKAYHHKTWEKMDWSEVYSEMQIDIDFTVDVIRHGIIN